MSELGEGVRHRFPVFQHKVYLNSCSQGALADSVRAAYEDYLRSLESEGSQWNHWVDRAERARAAFARVLHTEPDNVAVTTSASAGVSAVASALDFGERDTVVTTDLEFPTIGQIWHAQERRGARVVHVPAEADNTLSLDRLAEAIDERTAIVSVTHVCYRNGSRLDIEAIARLARDRGALVMVDSYQAAGAVPIDVGALGVDFVVGGALKYLLASPGVGYLYADPATTGRLVPTTTGWFADEDIHAMHIDRYRPSRTARRFEAGTPPISPGVRGHRGRRADAGHRYRSHDGARRTAERPVDRRGHRDGRCGGDAEGPVQTRSDGRGCRHRRRRTRGAARGGRYRHLVPCRQPADLAALLQHRRRHRADSRRAAHAPRAAP
jgi:selenocysteine lyase/cysteine desulfurase